MLLKDKNIVLGITGSIAAYKSCYLIRQLKKAGADVKCVMTESATHFITTETVRTLTQNEVITQLFEQRKEIYTEHISLVNWGDILVIAPATGNIIGKLAAGLGDDFLSTLCMAFSKKPLLIAPAMNDNMFLNPIVQDNIEYLGDKGVYFVAAEEGPLACGTTGVGRLAETDKIVHAITELLTERDLSGKRILITAGATREAIDPVRFISNRSSGRMGYELARAADLRGADVTLISGPTCLKPPYYVVLINVESAEEMHKAVLDQLSDCDIIIMAAAVADLKPKYSDSKLKKGDLKSLSIDCDINRDILNAVSSAKHAEQIVIGFALETEDRVKNASDKLTTKRLDFIVANSPETLGSESISGTIIDKTQAIDEFKEFSKFDLANRILEKVNDQKRPDSIS